MREQHELLLTPVRPIERARETCHGAEADGTGIAVAMRALLLFMVAVVPSNLVTAIWLARVDDARFERMRDGVTEVIASIAQRF